MSAWSSAQKDEFRKEHALIMPVSQPRHNLPHDDLKTYFDAIFAADCPKHKGMVTIAAIAHGSTEPRIVAVVPADKLGSWASQMHVSTRMNYYYGRAQHSGNSTWGYDNAFAFNTICVDIDDHTDGGAKSSAHGIAQSTRTAKQTTQAAKQSVRTVEQSARTIKQTAKSTGKATAKTAKGIIKTSQRAVKTAQQTSKAAIKTAQTTAKTAQKNA